MALLYKYREGGDHDFAPKGPVVDPVLEKPAAAEEVLARAQPLPPLDSLAPSNFTSDNNFFESSPDPYPKHQRKLSLAPSDSSSDIRDMAVSKRSRKRAHDGEGENGTRQRKVKIEHKWAASLNEEPEPQNDKKKKLNNKKRGAADLNGFIVPDNTTSATVSPKKKMAIREDGRQNQLLPAVHDPE